MPPAAAVSQTSLQTPEQPGNDTALQVENLSKTFRSGGRLVQALNSVSFRVRHGTVTGLIGPDSAGKTTLMRLAAGLLAPDTGSITVLGKNATTQSLEVQASIGYMPQRFGLYEDLTVQENLDLYADLQGVPKSTRARSLPGTAADGGTCAVYPASGRATLRRHEAKTGAGLHPGAATRPAVAGRTDRRRGPAVAK